ncbi:hypothetical protein MAPG_07603 [Magnaporthiopsis poae ATCC 64411]|uniref:SP-RING-type domain-containing protein n=1 Tax=Magnaporthiopsis poae (strain ATCC 64411 / 73-15) TaxID=644358 RepID=A0A0C4E542_MAGP6|nr:hypothetical protein MAPG_07603 [Magnaporthiopsis poae ATCC 64411]
MSSRRLVQGGASSASRRPGRDRPDAAPEMPPYERPAFTMSDTARQSLASLANNTEALAELERTLTSLSKLLPTAISSINDRLIERREDAERRAKRRRQQPLASSETPDADARVEQALAHLEDVVPGLSADIEAAARDVINYRYAVQDTKVSLREAHASVQAQPRQAAAAAAAAATPANGTHAANGEGGRRLRFQNVENVDDFLSSTQRAAADEEVDENGEGEGSSRASRRERIKGPPGPLRLYAEARKAKAAEFEALSAYDKYAVDNDYISLKKHWHDALHPDGTQTLPDAHRWFDSDGNPVLPSAAGGGEAGDGNDGDDDLIVAGVSDSLKCPLTLRDFEEPYSNNKCKHTFEKSAIVDILTRERGAPLACPVGGCPATFTLNDFFNDLVMKRRVDRANQRAEEEESDSEAEDADGPSMVETGARSRGNRRVKTEKIRS